MNHQTVTPVRSSWKQVEAITPAAAALFYSHLFAADPGLRLLVKGDMQQQGDKLMQMIGATVSKLDDLPALVPVLQGLGQRHAGYGVQAAHYDTVGAALLRTLDEGLGDDFTPPLRAAWREVYGTVAEVMLCAAHRPEGAPGPAAIAAPGVMRHERG